MLDRHGMRHTALGGSPQAMQTSDEEKEAKKRKIQKEMRQLSIARGEKQAIVSAPISSAYAEKVVEKSEEERSPHKLWIEKYVNITNIGYV